MTSSVPKFASFRPKPKPAAAEHSTEPSPPLPKKPRLDRQEPSPKSFVSDRRGDPDILRYGTLNRSEIPPYRRIGRGFVLGSDLAQKIDQERSSDKQVILTPSTRQRRERLLTAKPSAKDPYRVLRLVVPNEQQSGPAEDFIPVSNGRKSKRDDSDAEHDDAEDEQAYRDISRQAGSRDALEDPDTFMDSGEDPHAGIEITKRNSELLRRTREHPDNAQVWLDLLDHQEVVVRQDFSSDEELNHFARKQLADVRIAILEKALKKVGNSHALQIELYRRFLDEAQRTWNEVKVMAEWKTVLTNHSQSTVLWLQFLDYIQSSFTHFKYEGCRTAFIECFAAIGKSASHVAPENVLHVYIRMLSMMQQAGYQELALAIWQAIVEQTISKSTGDSLDGFKSFEEFWDSEAPRIGDPGAKGWRTCTIDDSPPQGPSHVVSGTLAATWYHKFTDREVDATEKLRYPGRAADDSGEDDAFHTIFFNDIEPYIDGIPPQLPVSIVLEAFLCFCGLPCLPRPAPHQQIWWSDPFLQHINSQSVRSNQDWENPFSRALESLSIAPIQRCQMTTKHLFRQRFTVDSVRVSAEFVQRLLKLVALSSPCEEVIGEYLLAFESSHFPKDAPKTAKQLIRIRPTSQRLYNAYGHVENVRGNILKADQVFSAALSMQKETSLLATVGDLQLLESWVWVAMEEGNHSKAFRRLVSPRGQNTNRDDSRSRPLEDDILNTQTVLSGACEQALLTHDHSSATVSTSLLALLAYLSHDHSMEAALTSHKHLTTWFISNRLTCLPPAELHAQCIAHLLLHHVRHAPMAKPGVIRQALEPHIEHFPDNIILLSLYAANEARFSVDDRVRGIMTQTVLHTSQATSVAGFSFAIQYEIMRGQIAGSTSHSIRALYKHATARDASGAHCPALWMSLLKFELAQLQEAQAKGVAKRSRRDGKKRTWETRVEEAEERVKETLYQGLSRMPWCKDFMMKAFTDCQALFNGEELWKVYKIMQEKELRLYTELDEPVASQS